MFHVIGYRPRNRNIAAPRAKIPAMKPLKRIPKADRAVNRKNKIMHQVDIADGIFIKHSPIEFSAGRIANLINKTQGFDWRYGEFLRDVTINE